MSISIELHTVSKITAEACHAESADWVDLTFEFKPLFKNKDPSTVIVFFNEAWMADAFAAAVNSINRQHVVVARNTAELMQQLRDCPENARRVT